MSQQGRDRIAGSEPDRASRTSRSSRRRSRVSDATDSAAGSVVYNDPTDRDSISAISSPPLPMKPPTSTGVANSDPRLAGNSADDYFNEIATTPSETPPATPSGAHALSRRRTSSSVHSLTHTQSPGRSSRRSRSHSSAKDILRLLLSAEGSESREALAMLRRAQERLEVESQRAAEAERRVQEANERWRIMNQARLQAQNDASRASEELRLFKLQLEAAQQQIARANDMIALTDKERAQAEDEAAKARRLAKKYEMEREIQRAREEGRREGLRQGLREAEQEDRWLRDMSRARSRPRYAMRARDMDDETYVDDPYWDPDDVDEEYPLQPAEAPMGPPDMQVQGVQQARRSEDPPGVVPGQMRSIGSRGTRASGGLGRAIAPFRRNGRGSRGPEIDRNVAVNPSNAPDVATIIDDEPINTLASPLPPEQTSQINHTTPTRMPEPNFNPDPSEVPPISMMNAPRSPAHPQVTIPPDGWIPRQDGDGSIRLPPPHEMSHAPPTPNSYISPLPNTTNLPPSDPALPQREREPIARDFVTPPELQPRSQGRSRHRYQRSVAESEGAGSDVTANLSIISPPGARSAVRQGQLTTIPEQDSRHASPNVDLQQAGNFMHPMSPRPGSMRQAEDGGIYVPGDPALDPALSSRRSIGNEGPVRPADMAGTFSPRSNYSRYSGPKRPAKITTPAPLAPTLDQPYTRPRTHSVASGSENSGFVGTPRFTTRSRSKTPVPAEYNRSRAGSAANTPGQQTPPEINVIPASRSESLQSRKSYSNDRSEMGMRSPRTRKAKSDNPRMPAPLVASASVPVPMPPQPEPPSPMNIPGMPKGFVPTSPMPAPATPIPEGAPPGFVPTSPAIPPGAPPGFLPASPVAPPGAPPGFLPTSPAIPSGAPPGFVPTSPAVMPVPHSPVAPPGAPPGFVPTSPVAAPPGAPLGFVPVSPVPDGAPPGFVPVSPHVPEGAPPGFVPVSPAAPVSTMIPNTPLPQPNAIASPHPSIAGALPVLPRSASDRSTRYDDPPVVTRIGKVGSGGSSSSGAPRSPRVSFTGPDAGFNSRAASDWDTRSAWGGDVRSEHQQQEHQTPRPVRGPDLSATIVRPGSSLSRKDSNPVIADRTTSRASRRSSRVGFEDPSAIPLPASTAPSLGRAGSYTGSRSHTPGPAVVRSQSARSDASRGRTYPPGTPGLPAAGLASPYSRRLDPHPEDDADEFEIVPSDDSAITLTTPPGRKRDIPPPGNTPRVPARNSLYRSPAAGLSRASLSAAAHEEDGPSTSQPSLHKSVSRQSIGSHTSYARYDPEDYVDPAVLTSGKSRLLSLPSEEPPPAETAPAAGGKGKKGKSKKGKGKNR